MPRSEAVELMRSLSRERPSAPPPPPPGLVTVKVDGSPQVLWPYTGTDVAGTLSDPLNLLLLGAADPRQVRAALLSVDGDRSALGLPDMFPFNARWSDAIGRHQTTYTSACGWQGSAIQMECGAYARLRVHLRLFRHGPLTLGNAHFETMIPGTTEHEVLSWEMARAMVVHDLARSGLLAEEPGETDVLTPAPTFRTVLPAVVRGVPGPLRDVLGLPLGIGDEPVPLLTSGRATVLRLRSGLPPRPTRFDVEFIHVFDQVIPRPFWSTGPQDLVKVQGPIHMTHRVHSDAAGRYRASFTASGVVEVTPIDSGTGEPSAAPVECAVSEAHLSLLTDASAHAAHTVVQVLGTEPTQAYVEALSTGRGAVFRQKVG